MSKIYDFDKEIDRKNTNSIKVDSLKDVFGKADLIPLWVADMDFLSPPEITEAMRKRVEHGVFGYVKPDDAYYTSIINWLKYKHDWSVDKKEISFSASTTVYFKKLELWEKEYYVDNYKPYDKAGGYAIQQCK